ncbi:hypothetical protein [Cellulomonas wangsupingiae]|nr:hypothetical protein [Cellulomonas wangsupingiae]
MVAGLAGVPGALAERDLAQDLVADGRPAVATDARVLVKVQSRARFLVSEVEVSFETSDGRAVTAPLAGPVRERVEDVSGGWQAPPPGSVYAPPLPVRYLAAAPHVVMGERELAAADGRWVRQTVTVAAAGGVPTVLGAAVWVSRRRAHRSGGGRPSGGRSRQVDGTKVGGLPDREEDAVAAGRRLAEEHHVHAADGTIADTSSHGNDPRDIPA